MIRFTRIRIQNYKSIKDATLLYNKGLWEVKGTNNDSTFKSNGAGKSTVLEAIQQGLYNKNIKGIKIEDTYYRGAKKGYCIVIDFVKDGISYTVINDRNNEIEIFQDNEQIDVRGTAQQLLKVKEIIGLDFNAFCALTYVSHQNVVQLLENISSSSLMKVLLDFDAIVDFNNTVKESLKESKATVQRLLREDKTSQDALDLMSDFTYTDTKGMYTARAMLIQNYDKDTKALDASRVLRLLNASEDLKSKYLNEINELSSTLSEDVCKACGTKLTPLSETTKAFNTRRIVELEGMLSSCNDDIKMYKDEYQGCLTQLKVLEDNHKQQLSNIDTKIAVAEYKNDIYHEKKESIGNLEKGIIDNNKRLEEEYFSQDVYNETLSCIKSGKLHKNLLESFTKVVNLYIDEYSSYLSLDYLNIKTRATKDSVDFVLYDKRTNEFIELNTLSGGELTRVRIVVLLSTLKAIGTLTKTGTNLLILDEALDTLDKSAADDLGRLFQHIITSEDKFIALVSHGEQLNAIDFTGTIRAVKSNNTTNVIQDVEELC